METLLDPVTTTVLGDLPVRPGDRCLELGPGGGSIAHWLTSRVGPTGRVVAVDKDTSRLRATDNLEVIEHDLRDGLPIAGTFNLIHARLLLLHLPQRVEIMRVLVDALAPGGWLVLGEFSGDPLHVYSAPSASDGQLFARVTRTLLDVLEAHGADMDWANRAHSAMRDAALTGVHTVEHAESWIGGGTGCLLHKVNSMQKEAALLEAGIDPQDLARFRGLMDNPGFAARSYRFVCTRGQRPMSAL